MTGGGRNEDDVLLSATTWQPKRRPAASVLGCVVREYLADSDSALRRAGPVLDAWADLLPPLLRDHCSPVAFEQGRLIVEVDPGPYMHELRLAAQELTAALKVQCPRARLRKVILRARAKPGKQGNAEE